MTSECLTVSLKGQQNFAYDDSLKAANEVLVFENNQVISFIKKFVRYKKFNETTRQKLAKKENFEAPKINMEKAVGNKTFFYHLRFI